MALETIRIKRTDLNLAALQTLLLKVEADIFKNEGKRITALALADPSGPDANHNLIGIDPTPLAPPAFTLRAFEANLDEVDLAERLVKLEDSENVRIRCFGTVLISDKLANVAICDPAFAIPSVPSSAITLKGKMSTFGGAGDPGVGFGEDLAWIENEQQAAAYPGFFLPGKNGEGFAHRLDPNKFYLACRWNYDVTPKTFLAQPTTFCTVTNLKTGASRKARPIDFGPSDTKPGAKDRVADLSPGLAQALGLETDDQCAVNVPTPGSIEPSTDILVDIPMAKTNRRSVVMLTGDYVKRHVRQEQARATGCAISVEFHFNSNGGSSKGSSVFFKQGDPASKKLAESVQNAFNELFKNHSGWGGNVLASNEAGGRSSFIDSYKNPAILLEPLFVSNPEQAAWIHDPNNLKALASAISGALLANTRDADIIGLSIGHLGKDSSPHDTGADCALHDTEATHGKALAETVRELLLG